MNPVKVVFRKFQNDEVIALFPELLETENSCLSYMHAGQHGEACTALIYELEVPTKEEYTPLYKELTEDVGYLLNVIGFYKEV